MQAFSPRPYCGFCENSITPIPCLVVKLNAGMCHACQHILIKVHDCKPSVVTGALCKGGVSKMQAKLLEHNVRFGDPECQGLMLRLKSDLLEALLAACGGKLADVQLEWSPDTALTVVMAAKGYPGSYQKGTVISKLDQATTAKVCPCCYPFLMRQCSKGNTLLCCCLLCTLHVPDLVFGCWSLGEYAVRYTCSA